jgi:hypothetical protein
LKNFVSVAAWLIIILTLSACGGGGSTKPTPAPPSNPTPVITPTNPGTDLSKIKQLYDANSILESGSRFVRDDGVLVTRIGDRGRERHAKDNSLNDHYLAHYWQYRTARIQLEDYVLTGKSLIRATFITEAQLGAREFRVWFWGRNTTGQFHFNPQKDESKVSPDETGVVFVDKGTFN